MKRTGLEIVLLCFATCIAQAHSPAGEPSPIDEQPSTSNRGGTKPAWLWSLDERLASRFDTDNMRARRELSEASRGAYNTMLQRPSLKSATASQATDVVDGNRNPELLIPTELFGQLVATALSMDPQLRSGFRSLLETRARQAGALVPDWAVFESVIAKYHLDEAYEDIRNDGGDHPLPQPESRRASTFEAFSLARCAQKAAALEALRIKFGREEFDRFLYQGVAPMMAVSGVRTAADLRHAEEGCQ